MSIQEEIKNSKFGIREVYKPTPKNLKRLAGYLGSFCTVFAVTLATNDFKVAAIIVAGIGLLIEKVVTPMFSDPNTTCITENADPQNDKK